MENQTDEGDDEEGDETETTPMEALELFSDTIPNVYAVDGRPPVAETPAPSPQTTTQSTDITQPPRPPDVQYATQSVPAGQENT